MFKPLIVLIFLFLPIAAVAEQSVENDTHVIHYNALSASFLSPSVAKQYGITRSKTRGLLNIAVLKKTADSKTIPVTAKVKARAVNLNSQTKNFAMREINEGEAIYYIGDFPVRNEETLKFIIDVVPDNGFKQTITFNQKFYSE